MERNNDDLKGRLRRLADEASPRPGGENIVITRSRTTRRVVAGIATLTAVALVGGLAGAGTLLGDRVVDPAPGREEASQCVDAGYDLSIWVPEENFHARMAELGARLKEHDAVESFEFVSAAEAFEEYRQENPDQGEPLAMLPAHARQTQYRVTMQPDADPHTLSGDLEDLAQDTYVPARECPPTPEAKFARYFFEVREGDTSASGVLEVNAEEASICLTPTLSNNITAVHLIDQVPDVPGARDESEVTERSFALSFIDPQDPPEDSYIPSGGGATCLRDQDRALLQQIVDEPQRFALDFHRGPNDPGLVAELRPTPEVSDSDVLETQGGRVRLEMSPARPELGLVPRVVLSNATQGDIGYGNAYELERQTAKGWQLVKNDAKFGCVATSELILLDPGEETSHVIGPHDRHCGVLPLPAGTYRVTKAVELESGERVPLTAGFEITGRPIPCATPVAGECGELQWTADVAAAAGFSFSFQDGGGAPEITRSHVTFMISAFVPEEEGSRSALLAEEGYEKVGEVADIPLFSDGRRLTWEVHGLYAWLSGVRGIDASTPGVRDIVEASVRVPYPSP